jgi:hypothetical protein
MMPVLRAYDPMPSFELSCCGNLHVVWRCCRPLKLKTLNLDGVLMQLPGPELEYIQAAAKQSTDFVIELSGAERWLDDATCGLDLPCNTAAARLTLPRHLIGVRVTFDGC